MYISLLTVNTGESTGRLWLSNRYRVHQRLCMAFPSAERKEKDPAFLCRYQPSDFLNAHATDYQHNHVHGLRTSEQAFLFRMDPRPGGNAVIVVQSSVKPDWDYAFHNAGFLLAGHRTFEDDLSFNADEKLRFWLEANPTRKVGTLSKTERLGHVSAAGRDKNGKRVAVPIGSLGKWLDDKAKESGFRIRQPLSITPGYVYFAKPQTEGHRLRSVRFEGTLEVTDTAAFREAIIRGIGPAKGFGFGLLSVASLRGVNYAYTV